MEYVLLATEIEFYVDTMKTFNMVDLGSQQWLEWHQRIQKLNQEALLEASNLKEEHVKEAIVSFQKIEILIHEVLQINIWKYKVLPHLLQLEPQPESTMIAYSILYHEAICVSLLELVTYHANCCESMEDLALDLLDYCCGTVSQLFSIKYLDYNGKKETATQELNRQRDNLSFDVGIRSLSIIRYLCENMERLYVGLCSSIYIKYDIPILFIEILKLKPWIRNHNEQYISGNWKPWDQEVLCPSEAQVLLTLRHILLDKACQQYYSITESRRTQLGHLMSFITPVILDQLSPLIELKQWISHICLMQQSSSIQNPILLEPVLKIRQEIIAKTDGNWKRIAQEQLSNVFNNDKRALMESARILNEAYNTELLEQFDTKSTLPCSRCGNKAFQRCSKCKKSWYCSRQCQVQHWDHHKEECQSV